MNDRDHARVKEIFLAACGLDPEGRAELLERECAGDPEGRRRVEELLHFHEADGDVLALDGLPARLPRLKAALEDRYRILGELGEGGMATVYLADDLKHHRQVAIKVLRPELAAVVGSQRFLAEIRVTAKLQHPHILPLYDSGEVDGVPFYVIPVGDAETLRDRLDREGPPPIQEAVRITSRLASALDYAHRQDVIHRDIKPSNIVLVDGEPLLADFGIALALDGSEDQGLASSGINLGTPSYMSPEQAGKDQPVGPPSDLYSLGCVLYEMLVGAPPFADPDPETVKARRMSEAVPGVRKQGVDVPKGLEAALQTVLAKAPEDRFSTAEEFDRALMGRLPGAAWLKDWRRLAAVAAPAILLGSFGWWVIGDLVAARGGEALPEMGEALTNRYRSVDPEVTEAYELGLRAFDQVTPSSLAQAIDHFHDAIAKDSAFAPAYAGLANTHNYLGGYYLAPGTAAFALGRRYAEQALDLDSTLAEAHAALALAKVLGAWDWDGAERSFLRALELDPDNGQVRSDYGYMLTSLRRLDEAVAQMRKAYELSPLNREARFNLGIALVYSGAVEAGMEELEKAISNHSDWEYSSFQLAHAYADQERWSESAVHYDVSLAMIEVLGQEPPLPFLALAGQAFAKAGQRERAEGILEELLELRAAADSAAYVPADFVGLLLAALGRTDEALDWVEQAYRDREQGLIYLKGFMYVDLRSQPRYRELVRKVFGDTQTVDSGAIDPV